MKIRSPRHLTWLMSLLALLILCLLTACDGGGTVEPPLTSDTATDTPADPVPTDGETTAPDTPSETTAESTSDGETTPAEETTTAPDTTIRLAVMSDVHIGKSNLSVDPAVKLAAALDTVNRVLGTPDAILLAGDLTDLGTDAQYRELNKILGEHVSEDTVICAVMGNHEYFRDGVVRYGGESEAFLKECQDAYKSAVGDLHTDTVVGGMHVISLSTLNSAADYTAATAFLCERVRAAAEEDPTMPIIVLTHEGFGSLQGTGGGRFSSELTKLLREYPQIISFSGHTHYALNDPRMIRQDLITTVQTSTVGADFWNYSGMDPAQPEGSATASQGLLVTVSPDKVVTVTRYDFTNDTTIGEAWVIDIPAVVESRDAFTYTDSRKNEAEAPAFPGNAKAAVGEITSYTATVTFPAAILQDGVSDGCITGYTVEVKDKTSGSLCFSKTLHGDSHMGSAAKESLTLELTGLDHGMEYTLTVTATGVWGRISEPLTAEFSTPTDENAAPEVMPDKLLDVDYTTGSPADTVSGLTVETFGSPVLKDGMAILDKESVYGYRLTDREYAAMKDSLALEMSLYVDPDQTYPWGYVTLVGNAESGGFDVLLYSDGRLLFEVNIGGAYKSITATAPKGEWLHIIASYDGQNIRLYVNGEAVASAACSGDIKHVAAISRILMVGADVNQNGVPQCISNVKVTGVTLYAGGITPKQAKALFEEAALPA